MCQLDWVIRCPDIWLNIILGMSVRVFLEMNIWVKQFALSSMSGPHITCLEAWTDQKRLNKGELTLLSASWTINLHLPSDLDWNLHHQQSWFSGLWTQIGTTHTAGSPGLLLANCRCFHFCLPNCMSQSLTIIYLSPIHPSIHPSISDCLFVWRTQTNTGSHKSECKRLNFQSQSS